MSQQPYPIPGMPPPPPPDHPKATTILVLGIVGHFVCGLTSPFALVMGARARREIAASQGRLGGSTMVTVGWVLGIVGTVELGLALLYAVVLVVLAVTSGSS
ncbi:MAG: DUF4190 domain-containing protein [Nocardioidaceae bacterium]|nr:DUF4190 domain-containing protein [Nocardioidaceae bacterium]